jgi:hypothetical protein
MARTSTKSALTSNSTPQSAAPIQRNPQKPRPKTIKVRVAGFKPHPNPYGDDNAQQYSFKLLANGDLAAIMDESFLDEWTQVNPREQKLDGPIMRDIGRTWFERPKEFFRVNRGVVLSAEAVKYEKDKEGDHTGVVELVLTDHRKHGMVDGAHSARKIIRDLIPQTYGGVEGDEDEDEAHQESEIEIASDQREEKEEALPEPDRYISCEVWTGLTLDQVAWLNQGRNTSRTVPPYGIMAIKGDFRALEEAIAKSNPEYVKKVAFKPNQHIEGLDEFRPISVLEILQLFMAADIAHSDSNNHPIEAYKNRGFAAKYFAPRFEKYEDGKEHEVNPESRREEYEKMYPLVGDFLRLYDMLRQTVPDMYDAAQSRPRHWSKVIAGKGGRVDNRRIEPLYYVDPSGDTKVVNSPNALFFPMFSAFRAHLKESNGQYKWADGVSPTEWPKRQFEEACQKLALKVAKAARGKDSLHAVGRDEQVWDSCYESLNSLLGDHGRKKKA